MTMTEETPEDTPVPIPYRQIRAHYDSETITLYQAYPTSIARPAVTSQCLTASPSFRLGRMTWVKPSWCWMMYRSGYSFKDPGQSRILALKMKHEDFIALLRRGVLAHGEKEGEGDVRVQWDPERGPRLEKFEYRSIQIGIPGGLSRRWADEWVVGIEDVTERARELKRVVEEEQGVTDEKLVERGLVPVERVFPVPDDVMKRLRMD